MTRATLVRFAGPLAIAVAGVAMLAHTWRTWPDPLIDFGRELYLAWRVSEPRQTLAALPEGVMLSYLARRRSALAYP
jgi:hypothetical protein